MQMSAVGSSAPCSTGLCSHQCSWAMHSPTEHQSSSGGELPYQFLPHFPLLYSHKLEHLVLFSTSSAFFFATSFFLLQIYSPLRPAAFRTVLLPGALGDPPQVMPFPTGAAVGSHTTNARHPHVHTPQPELGGCGFPLHKAWEGPCFLWGTGKLPCLQRAAFQSCWEIPGSVGLRGPSVLRTLWDSRAAQRAVLL